MAVPTGYAARLELVVLAAWLMKDFSWVLLIPALAFPMALAAVSLEGHSVLLDWKTDSRAVRVHGVAALLWIVGNVTWMTSEMLWDSSSFYDKVMQRSVIPWNSGPLSGAQLQEYSSGVRCAQVCFGAALVLLASFYMGAACGCFRGSSRADGSQETDAASSSSSLREADPLVWGFVTSEVYTMVFIGPWILKDIFWTLQLLAPALICSAIVFGLVADSFRRFGRTSSKVEMAWVMGNTVWILGELGESTPSLRPRLAAAGLLVVGVATVAQAFTKLQKDPAMAARDHLRQAAASESTSLIGK